MYPTLKSRFFGGKVAAETTSDNFRFVSALAQFGMLLRNSEKGI